MLFTQTDYPSLSTIYESMRNSKIMLKIKKTCLLLKRVNPISVQSLLYSPFQLSWYINMGFQIHNLPLMFLLAEISDPNSKCPVLKAQLNHEVSLIPEYIINSKSLQAPDYSIVD